MSNTIDLGVDYLTDLRLLGRGGFSVVYAATDTRFDRQVAVKVLDVLSDESDKRRFERECRLMGRLSSHANVVTVFDSGYSPDGSPYLIMELVPGGSLADRLDQQGRLRWEEAVDLVIPIAAALQKAHESNILHRDVKPANVLVADGTVKLTDFGISSFRDSSGATSANIAASWLHTPPETFPNKRDARSDLYSLGSTLYTLIVGNPPLWREGEESLEPLMYRILHEPVPAIPPAVAPAAVNQFLQWVLAKDPDHRPQTAVEFAAALAAIRRGEAAPVTMPVSTPIGPPGAGSPRAGPLGTAAAASVGPQAVAPVSDPAASAARVSGKRNWWRIAVPVGSFLAIVAMAWVALSNVGGGVLRDTGPSNTGQSNLAEQADVSTSPDDDVTTTSATVPPTNDQPTAAVEATEDTAAAETTTSTTAPTTTTETTVAAPAFDTYGPATVVPQSVGLTEFANFLADRTNQIVELDVIVVLPNFDDFQDGSLPLYESCDGLEPGGEPNFLGCSGYVLRFLNESAGTSSVGWERAEDFRVSGFFAVGSPVGPNQGYLTIPLDPVSPADALAAGG